MKLYIENLARIHKAEIELNGITVIAGYNSTGKSTISKALVGCMKAYSGMNQKIKTQRIMNMMRALDDVVSEALPETLYMNNDNALRKLSKQIVEDSNTKLDVDTLTLAIGEGLEPDQHNLLVSYIESHFDKILEDIKKKREVSDQEYVTFFVNNQLRRMFDQQINTFGSSKPSIIDFSGKEEIHIEIVNNRVTECPAVSLKESEPFYIEPKHMLDESSTIFIRRADRTMHQSLMMDETTPIDSMTLDQYAQKENASQIVTMLANNVMHGRLRPSDDSVLFFDNDFQENVSVKNIASGIKSMALIARLIENGSLSPNGFLIIDEPEVNLHPEWQLRFANFLVRLNQELGIQILLTTHSPYFLRALEVYSNQLNIFDSLKLYMTKACVDVNLSQLFELDDVTNNPNIIFKQLYLPLEEL